MDHVSHTQRDTRRDRRTGMRDRARGLRPGAGVGATPGAHRFETPEWLERSFVLPLTEPEVTDVPSQPVPRHDDVPEGDLEAVSATAPVRSPGFVRPPAEEIDFAAVVRRADRCRTATRTAMGATAIAGLALIAYLLSGSPVVLVLAIACALAAAVALGLRLRLGRARVPRRRA